MNQQEIIALKAQLLCEGFTANDEILKMFENQNPSNVKRGGLSSGGKMQLANCLFVSAPYYRDKKSRLEIIRSNETCYVRDNGKIICSVTILERPEWYSQRVGNYSITQILTAHNRQLAGAVFEDCVLFKSAQECAFCAIHNSLTEKHPDLIVKKAELFLAALENIPLNLYGGLTLNGGMTFQKGRGMEYIYPVVKKVKSKYQNLPIAIEMTPPRDLDWINRIAGAGVDSLMMNLECWDLAVRRKYIPGKDEYCPRDLYLKAFERALECFGEGKVTTCFVVGLEPYDSLKEGIDKVTSMGIIPSPIAGRYFEDISDYPFNPDVNLNDFLDIIYYSAKAMQKYSLNSVDKAGCVACGMCDLIKDMGG